MSGLVLWVGMAWFAGLLRIRFAGVCWFGGWFGNLVYGALVFVWWLCSGLSGDCWLRCNWSVGFMLAVWRGLSFGWVLLGVPTACVWVLFWDGFGFGLPWFSGLWETFGVCGFNFRVGCMD